jgi:hypothetical protein
MSYQDVVLVPGANNSKFVFRTTHIALVSLNSVVDGRPVIDVYYFSSLGKPVASIAARDQSEADSIVAALHDAIYRRTVNGG